MANDFSGDPNCVALWRFEDTPGFVVDSQGSNDLTNTGADEENTYYKEGSQSSKFVKSSGDEMNIADADLDVGFPWRYNDGGSAEKDFSICFWIRLNTLPSILGAISYIASKYSTAAPGLRCFAINIQSGAEVADCLAANLGITSGTSFEGYTVQGYPFVINRWYHVAVRYDDSARRVYFTAWDDTAGNYLFQNEYYDYSGTTEIEDVQFSVGARSDQSGTLDGYLDEMVVFNRVITSDEVDVIRQGTFSFGWTGKICGVTNPSKICGIAVVDIAKVSGI